MKPEDLHLDSVTQRAVAELATEVPRRVTSAHERADQVVRRVRRELMAKDLLTFVTARLVTVLLAIAGGLYSRCRQWSNTGSPLERGRHE
jgi:hypothetical protein